MGGLVMGSKRGRWLGGGGLKGGRERVGRSVDGSFVRIVVGVGSCGWFGSELLSTKLQLGSPANSRFRIFWDVRGKLGCFGIVG